MTQRADGGFGELWVSPHEQADLARIRLRGALRWDPETCGVLSLPRITLGILDYEFPCLSGSPDDDLRRVYFAIESIPRVYGTYCSLNISLDTLAAWQAPLAALAAGRVHSVVLRSAREGFLLRMSRPAAGEPDSAAQRNCPMMDAGEVRTRFEGVRSINVGGPPLDSQATLAIYCEGIDPDAVSAIVGCSPTSALREGDRDPNRPERPPARIGQWFLEAA